jgi:hypothetical protein
MFINWHWAHPRGKEGCRAAAPKTPQNRNLRNTDFVDIMIPNVLRDISFSRNQPLKSADDQYIGTLKSKLIIKKNKKTEHSD